MDRDTTRTILAVHKDIKQSEKHVHKSNVIKCFAISNGHNKILLRSLPKLNFVWPNTPRTTPVSQLNWLAHGFQEMSKNGGSAFKVHCKSI